MQFQGTTLPAQTEVEAGQTDFSEATAVFGLSYGELAVALYASDLPTRAMRGVPRLALIEYAAQGLARIGVELAWWTNYRSRRIAGNGPWTAEGRAEYARMWPNKARSQAAHDAAMRLTGIGGPDSDAHPWPGTDTRTVEVAWAGYTWRVALSDLENASRYPHRTATDPHLSAMLRSYTAPGRRRALLPGEAA